jgi:uncharacterized RDD family membrane protein YckC
VEDNPYQSPQSVVADFSTGADLASRGARLGAALLDGLIMMLVIMPVMYFGGYFTALGEAAIAGKQPFALQIGWGVVGIAIAFAIQYIPLKASGQTWGKKIVGLRIVDMQGQQPGIGVLLGKRYLFANGVGLLPIVGALISTVNVLLIFRSDKRCLHDLVAGTQVINAK